MEIIVIYSNPPNSIVSKLRSTFEKFGVKVITEKTRTGKANAINLALKHCKGEICIITDSDSFLEKNAIKFLIESFSDDQVGAISGNLVYSSLSSTDKLHTIVFSKFKGGLKHYEALLDSCSYAPGELLAFRKSLIKDIPMDSLCDDYHILLKIRSKGYRCVNDLRAIVHETPPKTLLGKLKRTRRVTAGTLQEAARHRFMFFNPTFGTFGLLIFPIYILRIFLLPFFLISLVINVVLILIYSFPPSILIMLILVIMVGLFALKLVKPMFALISYCILLIAGLLLGLVDWIKGDLSFVWEECKT